MIAPLPETIEDPRPINPARNPYAYYYSVNHDVSVWCVCINCQERRKDTK